MKPRVPPFVPGPAPVVLDKKSLQELVSCLDVLQSKVYGQPFAAEALADGFMLTCNDRFRSQMRPSPPHRGVFLFGGPTGTGKTEMAKAISEALPSFFPKAAFLHVSMNNFVHDHEDAKLFGSPPGYLGSEEKSMLSKFFEAHASRGVVLLDEFEKASPKIFVRFLDIFDEGKYTDNKGATYVLRGIVFIVTTNLGVAELTAEEEKFLPTTPSDEIRRRLSNVLENAMKAKYSPEFINRISNICPFLSIGPKHLAHLIPKILKEEVEDMLLKTTGCRVEYPSACLRLAPNIFFLASA